MKPIPLSFILISKKNLIHNFQTLKRIAGKRVKIAVVIKGNAYGHGEEEVAKILEPYAQFFQVNSVAELSLLRRVSKKQVLLLGYVEKSDLPRVLKLGCILTVFSMEELKEIEKVAKKLKMKQTVHMPVDAYLGREGFLEEEWKSLLGEIKKSEYLKLGGIYAHFANIEDTNDFAHAEKQIKKYEEVLQLAEKLGFKNLETHISATSGLLVYEKNKGLNSLIRLGIGVYGLWPSENIKHLYKGKFELEPVLAWKTKIAQIKTLPQGWTVGYGLTYRTKKPTRIAVIPVGYADGFPRNLSNKGEVLIGGMRCKVLGRVAMNMFVVDINHLKKAKIEEEVVLLGKQGKEEITAEEIAEKSQTINYEVVTRLSPLIKRLVI